MTIRTFTAFAVECDTAGCDWWDDESRPIWESAEAARANAAAIGFTFDGDTAACPAHTCAAKGHDLPEAPLFDDRWCRRCGSLSSPAVSA